jgi:hypothetical protein
VTEEQIIRLVFGIFALLLMGIAIVGYFGWWGVMFIIGFIIDHALTVSKPK